MFLYTYLCKTKSQIVEENNLDMIFTDKSYILLSYGFLQHLRDMPCLQIQPYTALRFRHKNQCLLQVPVWSFYMPNQHISSYHRLACIMKSSFRSCYTGLPYQCSCGISVIATNANDQINLRNIIPKRCDRWRFCRKARNAKQRYDQKTRQYQ